MTGEGSPQDLDPARPHTGGPPPSLPPRPARQRLGVLVQRALRAVVPKDQRRAVLYGVPAANDGIRVMVSALAARGVDCVVLVESSDDEDTTKAQLDRPAGLITRRRRSARAMWQVARSRFVFITHELYGLPPGRGQLLVNLWHGEFTKRLGLWTSDRGVASTYATATSQLGAAFRAAEFGLSPQQVLVVGSPRNDRMLDITQDAARQQLGLSTSRRVLLWLPTYRTWPDRRCDAPSPDAAELTALDSWLADRDLLLVVKPHPLAPSHVDVINTENIRIITNDGPEGPISVATLLAASDGLITDFSSTWCDYLLLDRPIWIHCTDYLDLARHGHMLLLPVEHWLPGPLSSSIEQLKAAIDNELNGDNAASQGQRRRLLETLHEHRTGSAAERLLDQLMRQHER